MRNREFTLADFMAQLSHVRRLGPIDWIMGMIPGMSEAVKAIKMSGADLERQLDHLQAIYDSMTEKERQDTSLFDSHRRARIARGAGVEQREVIQFEKQFESARHMMRAFNQ